MSEQELRDKVAQTFWGTSYEQTPQSEQVRVDQVVALITQYANEARLNELSYFYEDDDGDCHRLQVDEDEDGNDYEIPSLSDRIAELEQESKS